MRDVKLADQLQAELARLRSVAQDAGFNDEQIAALLAKHEETFKAPEQLPVVCGNVDKATRYPCTRAPHLDEPFNRSTHTFQVPPTAEFPDGQTITWRSPLNLHEQVAAEIADLKGRKAKACSERRCIRAPHGPDVEHAAWEPFVPDPAIGPQPDDPEQVLNTWSG
jgi:hypothetical protein